MRSLGGYKQATEPTTEHGLESAALKRLRVLVEVVHSPSHAAHTRELAHRNPNPNPIIDSF